MNSIERVERRVELMKRWGSDKEEVEWVGMIGDVNDVVEGRIDDVVRKEEGMDKFIEKKKWINSLVDSGKISYSESKVEWRRYDYDERMEEQLKNNPLINQTNELIKLQTESNALLRNRFGQAQRQSDQQTDAVNTQTYTQKTRDRLGFRGAKRVVTSPAT